MTLTEFLTARLDEELAAAAAATPGPWEWVPGDEGWTSQGPDLMSTTATWTLDGYGPYPSKVIGAWGHDAWGISIGDADAAHVVRYNPARVLREVEAKRKILAGVGSENGHPHEPVSMRDDEGNKPSAWPEAMCAGCNEVWPCPTVCALAAIYSDHPDYDPAWA